MENAAIEAARFLVRLIFPIGLIAVCVGLVTLGAAVFPPKRVRTGGRIFAGPLLGNRASMVERIAVGICGLIGLLGLVIAVQTVRLRTPSDPPYWSLSVLLVVATIVMGLPAILWKTPLRWAAEGLATIALAVAAGLTGFSIGFAFIPLMVAMIWVCVQHLRDIDKSPAIDHALSG